MLITFSTMKKPVAGGTALNGGEVNGQSGTNSGNDGNGGLALGPGSDTKGGGEVILNMVVA